MISLKNTVAAVFLAGIMFAGVSCQNAHSDQETLENYRWWRTDVKTFEFEIAEETSYDILFFMRYITAYPYPILKVHAEMTKPEGTTVEKDIFIKAIDEKGKYIGDVAGDMWDIESPVSEKEILPKGKYTLTLTHAMPDDPVVALMSVGYRVRISE